MQVINAYRVWPCRDKPRTQHPCRGSHGFVHAVGMAGATRLLWLTVQAKAAVLLSTKGRTIALNHSSPWPQCSQLLKGKGAPPKAQSLSVAWETPGSRLPHAVCIWLREGSQSPRCALGGGTLCERHRSRAPAPPRGHPGPDPGPAALALSRMTQA